jgi:hypothetical protein
MDDTKKEIEVSLTISRDTLENIFITALEGGSNYWYFLPNKTVKLVRRLVPKENDECLSTAIFKAVFDLDATLSVHDLENPDEEIGLLRAETMAKRIGELLKDESYRKALLAEMNGDGDVNTSDIVFQYITIGEVMFS